MLAGLGNNLRGDHTESEVQPKRCDDKVVEVPDHRDEVGDEVDWTDGVSDDECGEGPCVPRGAGIPVCEVESVRLTFKLLGLGSK